jgi:DMSO/TMAO reductase YedYZ molybdopterin-dependent catalytic subunit
MLYRFRVWSDLTQEFACSIRILAYRDNVKLVISTINEELLKELPKERISQLTVVESEAYSVLKKSYAEDDIPRGQRVIPKLIVYRILGQPRFDIGEWRLRIEGHVTNNIELTYDELLSLPTIKYKSDFHCVTGWSVKNIEWEGVPLRYFAEKAGVKEGVEWVHFESMDGYTTVVHIDDFMDENAILAIRMDGKPLRPEHGYPARAFIPHLYGWKGAKWVTKITFLTRYTDGYWEALGYHERGNAWLEERFKQMKNQV